MQHKDRIYLITGATGAIGEATARAAAQAGAQLVLAGRTVAKLVKLADSIEAEGGVPPVLFPVDLAGAGPADYEEMGAALRGQFGRVDGVVHLAATMQGLTPLGAIEPERWQKTLNSNLSAPFLINQALEPLLRASSAGRIVFIGEDAGQVRKAYWGAYGVSKAGLATLADITREELESSSIDVHLYTPPPTRSKLRGQVFISEDPGKLASPETAAGAILDLLAP